MRVLTTILAVSLITISYTGKHVVDDRTYDLLLELSRRKGQLGIPKTERSRFQQTVLRRYHRWLPQGLRIAAGKLYLNDKRVMKQSDIKKRVLEAFHESKGLGCRRLKYQLSEAFTGCSEKNVFSTLKRSKKYHRLKCRFSNKAPLRPVTAKSVMSRNQVDLIHMEHVVYKERTYRYILSLLDVFSRFTFLRPLQYKNTGEIARHLRDIFKEHGPPHVLQCDRGKEFHGEVSKLCTELDIKMVRSRPYHPQSQRKVERSHRTLRNRILYDLLGNSAAKGMNWVENLPDYASVMNNEPKEVLRWQTPFAVYFGRKRHKKTKSTGSFTPRIYEEDGPNSNPSMADRSAFLFTRRSVRSTARLATKRCSERLKRRQSQKPLAEYAIGQEVFVRYKLNCTTGY